MNYFGVYDYIVFALTLAVSIAIGLFFGCRNGTQNTTSEFIDGNRQMKVIPLAISLMVSFESSIMVLGMPAEAYVYGLMYILSSVGFMITLVVAAYLYAEFFHGLGISSIYEYLQLRFKSPMLRNVGMMLGIFVYLWYMGIVLFGPAIALESVTGFPLWYSISLVSLSSIIYTAIGGIKAVIWTDVFQCVIMYTSLITGFAKGIYDVGGVGRVLEISHRDGRLQFDTRFNPWVRHTIWSLLFGSIIRSFSTVFNQTTFQRVVSAKTSKEAIRVMLLTAPLYGLTTGFAIFQGLIAYAYFVEKRCDPLASGQVTNPNQIMPLYMMEIFKFWPGMPGMFVAGLFSASLSTLSSGLSSVSTITWVDIIKPRIKPVSEFRATIFCKFAVVFYGFMSMCIALLVSQVSGTLTQIGDSLTGALTGPIAGLLLFASLCPWANTRGALIGSISAVFLSSWIAIGSTFSKTRPRTPFLPAAPIDGCFNPNGSYYMQDVNSTVATFTDYPPIPTLKGLDWLYTISYMLISPIGVITVLLVGSAISLPFYNPYAVDKRYVVLMFDKLCGWLPRSVRRRILCGAHDSHKIEVETVQLQHRLCNQGNPVTNESGLGTIELRQPTES